MVLLNTVIRLVDIVLDKSLIAFKAVADSNIPNILVFRNRNESPWLLKESDRPVLKGPHLCYCINDKKFYELAAFTNMSVEVNKMDDIILAELVDSSGVGVCDMSELFHSVSWNFAPSLYELVITNTLMNKIVVSEEYLNGCVLNVTTLTHPSLSLKMSSPVVKEPFSSWDVIYQCAPDSSAPEAPPQPDASSASEAPPQPDASSAPVAAEQPDASSAPVAAEQPDT
jgi:hypothetical protein